MVFEEIILARMSKEVFFKIPKEVRDQISGVTVEVDDFEELRKDEIFNQLYKIYKKSRNDFNKHKHKLRHG